ncbi:uncharacterized protein LOC108738552 [Agrilus planipennis]|uniref:Uncharacterized protein LOC108738552 n=1 Tax=Agrilus planipennis TaxID=224129 RepID=A0A1W4X558_AGRPL|nr:uncharacterized protein LOC108738552 [Agrilus planipennis]
MAKLLLTVFFILIVCLVSLSVSGFKGCAICGYSKHCPRKSVRDPRMAYYSGNPKLVSPKQYYSDKTYVEPTHKQYESQKPSPKVIYKENVNRPPARSTSKPTVCRPC